MKKKAILLWAAACIFTMGVMLSWSITGCNGVLPPVAVYFPTPTP